MGNKNPNTSEIIMLKNKKVIKKTSSFVCIKRIRVIR